VEDIHRNSGLRVLITGDLGFVGSATKKYFLEKGLQFVGYDIMQDGCDVTDIKKLEETVTSLRVNRILHLAAIARFSEAKKDRKLAFETNALGTRNIAIVANKYHIPVVYASTGSVYMPIEQEGAITEEFDVEGNSAYGCSKALGESFLQYYGAPYIILRYAHLYGKEKRMHGLIGGFLDRIERGLAPMLYGGKQSNDFTYIKDVVHANYLAVTASWDKWSQAYNIGTGEELTAEKAGKIICSVAGYKGKTEKRKGRSVDPERFYYDCSKAKKMLGFEAKYSFKQGLKDMYVEPKQSKNT
jgi:nucleoside-diphosphate-sugar epimerase